MNLEWTDEQEALRDTMRRFLADKAPLSWSRSMLDDPTGITEDVQQGLVDLGTNGLLVPVEHGGAGMGMVEAGVVLEELGRVVHPGPWPSSAVAAVRALTTLATEEAGGALLAGIADGTTTATLALRGAVAARGGALSGALTEVPDAAAADVLLVFAADDNDEDDPALFAVDTRGPDVDVVETPTIDRTRKQFRVVFTDAPARRLGAAPASARAAVVDDVLVATAADALGAAQAVLDIAVGYANVRQQFGQPIGAFQAVQHLCVDMYESVELARGGVLHALWAADAMSGPERHLAALRAKGFAGRLATVGDTAIQVLGGIGFTWEHDAHLFLKRLLSWSAFLGSPDRYLEELGRDLALTANG